MGCDIHSFAERREGGRWVEVHGLEPFGDRSYSVFGWLAGVRNYSAVAPIAEPRGLPDDISSSVTRCHESWGGDAHTESWLSVQEFLAVDYDREVEDLRVTKQLGPNFWTGGATGEPGEGERMPLRDFLGANFFRDLTRLQDAGAERVVFWFDN